MRCCCSPASLCSRATFLIRVARLRGVDASMATWLNLRFDHLLSASIFVMPAFGSARARLLSDDADDMPGERVPALLVVAPIKGVEGLAVVGMTYRVQ